MNQQIEINNTRTISDEDVLFIALELGEHILRCGGEINRAEDTITRICRAYGAKHVDVTAILSMIVLTVHFNDSRSTCTRRITSSTATNLDKLSKINELSRSICAELPDKKTVEAKMAEISRTSIITKKRLIFGSILAALGFALFFSDFSQGITASLMLRVLLDSVLSGVLAIPLCLISVRMDKHRLNPMVSKFAVCFLSGISALVLGRLIPLCNPNIIMIGNIMNFIPGVAVTNAFRDLFGGDIMSGLFRLCSVIIDAIIIAAGYAVAILLFGGAV